MARFRCNFACQADEFSSGERSQSKPKTHKSNQRQVVLPFYEEKTYMPCEVRAKVGHRLLSQVYFLHTFALIACSIRLYGCRATASEVDSVLWRVCIRIRHELVKNKYRNITKMQRLSLRKRLGDRGYRQREIYTYLYTNSILHKCAAALYACLYGVCY